MWCGDSIEQRAEAALDAQAGTAALPPRRRLCREQGDLDLYRASRRGQHRLQGGHRGVHFGTLPGQPAGQRRGAPGDRAVRLHPHPLCAGKHRTADGMGWTVQPGQQSVGQDRGHPAQPGRLRRRPQPGLRGGQPPRSGRSVLEPGAAGLFAAPAADAGGNPRRGRPAVAGASCAGYAQQPPRHPLHGPRLAGLSGPAPAPRPTTS